MFQYVAVSVTQNLVFFFFFFLVEFLKDYFLSVYPLPFTSSFPLLLSLTKTNYCIYFQRFILWVLFVFLAALGLCCCVWTLLRLAGFGAHGLSSRTAQVSLTVRHGFSCLEACGPRDWTCVPCIGRRTLNHGTTRKVAHSFCLTRPNLEVYNAIYLFIWLHQVLTAALGTLVVHHVGSFTAAWLRLSSCRPQTPEWEGFSGCSTWARLLMLLLLLLLSHLRATSCPTQCNPIDGSPPGSAVPGILQARTLEWVAIAFSSAWKWKVKVKSLRRVWLLVTPWTAAHQAPPSMGFSRQEYWSGVPLPSPWLLIILCI